MVDEVSMDELAALVDASLTTSTPDEDDFTPRDETPLPVPDLDAAVLCVAAALSDPDVRRVVTAPGAVVVLRTAQGWASVIGPAWRHVAHGLPLEAQRSAVFDGRGATFRALRGGPLHVLPESMRKDIPLDGSVKAAIRDGIGVVFLVDPGIALARDLVSCADAVVEIPAPTPEILSALAARYGNGQAPLLTAAAAAAATPSALVACLRPGQSAAEYLSRLDRFAAASRPVPHAGGWDLDRMVLSDDVAAAAKEMSDDMRDYAAVALEWSDIARPAALLSGPPGCGKTTLAGAIASSAGVPLFTTSYAELEAGEDGKSDYRQMSGAIRKWFLAVRAAAPCVALIDEADAFIGRTLAAHNASYFGPLVTQLLTEVNSERNTGVMLLMATNHPDRIDSALLRSGRLDTVLTLSPPSGSMLARLLAAHSGLPEADLRAAAAILAGATGADCERLVRVARRAARVDGRRPLTAADVLHAAAGWTPPEAPEPEDGGDLLKGERKTETARKGRTVH